MTEKNVTYNSAEKSKIATRQSFDNFEEDFNVFIYRMLSFFLPLLEENFSRLIPGNNDIEVKLENVVANGRRLNWFNQIFIVETAGNENILF